MEFQIFHPALSKIAYSNAFGEEGRRGEEKTNKNPRFTDWVVFILCLLHPFVVHDAGKR